MTRMISLLDLYMYVFATLLKECSRALFEVPRYEVEKFAPYLEGFWNILLKVWHTVQVEDIGPKIRV